jgi:hypothetical protein
MPTAKCQELATLERAVLVAVQKLYAAKDADGVPLRAEEFKAFRALQEHLDTHQCGDAQRKD